MSIGQALITGDGDVFWQVDVDGELQILPRNGVLDSQVAHLPAMAIDNHIPRPVLAAEQLVIGFLDAGLAHYVARLVVLVPRPHNR